MPTNSWNGTWHGLTPTGLVHTRSREIISPSGGIVRGKFPSRKTGRMVHHEGLLELDAIYLFETSPLVASYREQPLKLAYPDGHRLRRYTPDFELTLSSGEIVLIEVKPSRSLQNPEVRHKLTCVAQHLQRSGQAFVILEEDRLRKAPLQANLRWIYHAAPRRLPTFEACRAARDQLLVQFPLTFRTASERLSTRAIDPYSLLLFGLAHCALDIPVVLDTPIHVPKDDDHVWFHIAEGYGF